MSLDVLGWEKNSYLLSDPIFNRGYLHTYYEDSFTKSGMIFPNFRSLDPGRDDDPKA